MTDTNYVDDLGLLTNTLSQAGSLLYTLGQTATGGIGLYVNANVTLLMCFKHVGTISILNVKPLKLIPRQ